MNLFVDGARYMLVYVILNSSCHFCGVAVIRHQYVLYDGMLTKMRYIDGSECFSKDDNYSVGSLWYQKIHPWSSSVKTRVESQIELPTEKVTSKEGSMENQKQSLSNPVSKKDGTNKSSKKGSKIMSSGVEVKVEGNKNNKVQPQRRTPSKRKRFPKVKYSPSDQDNTANKRKKYPIGISISSGSSSGIMAACRWCHGYIMRSQWRAIKRVKRDVGIGFDTSQYHFYCTKKALSANELQQLLDVIAASDEDTGLKSAWTAAVTKERGKTA
jgi:hypothetical protein